MVRLLHIFYALVLVIWAGWAIFAMKKGKLKGRNRVLVPIAIGCFALAWVLNTLHW